jgi:glutamyl-tRNA(Gln) amidotransferase subunit D
MMSHDKSSGYKGRALEAIKKVQAEIGDILRITKDGKVYEGILIPRSEYGDEKNIVIKLRSGYNVGIAIAPKTTIQRLGKGTKPTFAPPAPPLQNPGLPRVAVMSTGGTIASRVDYRTGAVRPALTASDLYSVVPELANIAQIEAEILLSLFSENMLPRHWTEIAKAIAQKIAEGVDGVVIPHGTDTMGYTAAALSFALQDLPVPVVLVGSQRSADRPSSDAASNLIGAVIAAARSPFAEVAVAMHETSSDASILIHRGTKVRKCHTSSRDAFRSVNDTPLARIQDHEIASLRQDYRKREPERKLVLKPEFSEKVALIKFHPGFLSSAIDMFVKENFRGIILEGTGLGHIGKNCYESVQKAVQSGVVVGMTSQCIWGRVNMNVYDTGRDLQTLGVIPLGDMLPETALVKLMWIFGQTLDAEEAKRLLITNIAGELTLRTLPEKLDAE